MNATQNGTTAAPKLTLLEALLKARDQLDRIEKRILDAALRWLYEHDRPTGHSAAAVAEAIKFGSALELRHILNTVAGAVVPIPDGEGKTVGHFVCSYDEDQESWRYFEVPGDIKAAMKAQSASHGE